MVAYRSNKFDDAIKLLNKIIKTEPKFIDAHIILGSVYYDKKNFPPQKNLLMKQST